MRSALLETYRRRLCRRWKHLLRKNGELHNLHGSAERGFVIGTGPSLARTNLKPLSREVWFGVNGVFMHPDLDMNTGYWLHDNGFVCPTDPGYRDVFSFEGYFLPKLRIMEEKTKSAHCIFPVQAAPYLEKYSLFQGRNIHFFFAYHLISPEERLTDSRLDLRWAIPEAYGLLETAIIVAAFTGVKKIYLVGADSDHFMTTELSAEHFYGDQNPAFNHQRDLGIENYSREARLHYGFMTFRSLRLLGEALKERGVEIFNATAGGCLDVFPRVDYSTLFD